MHVEQRRDTGATEQIRPRSRVRRTARSFINPVTLLPRRPTMFAKTTLAALALSLAGLSAASASTVSKQQVTSVDAFGNRITKVRVSRTDAFGNRVSTVRVVRTSGLGGF